MEFNTTRAIYRPSSTLKQLDECYQGENVNYAIQIVQHFLNFLPAGKFCYERPIILLIISVKHSDICTIRVVFHFSEFIQLVSRTVSSQSDYNIASLILQFSMSF